MSSNVSFAQVSMVWNEKTVLENAMPFLVQKKEELKLYQDLWEAAQGIDYYSSTSKLAAEKVKAVAEKSSKEVELLDEAVAKFLNAEIVKDPLSDQSKQFKKIALASRHGLNYFTSVLNDTYYPTAWHQAHRDGLLISNKLAFSVALLTGAVDLANHLLFDYELPSYTLTPLKVSVAACICFNAIRYLNRQYMYNPKVQQLNYMKAIFEKALSPEKAAEKAAV